MSDTNSEDSSSDEERFVPVMIKITINKKNNEDSKIPSEYSSSESSSSELSDSETPVSFQQGGSFTSTIPIFATDTERSNIINVKKKSKVLIQFDDRPVFLE